MLQQRALEETVPLLGSRYWPIGGQNLTLKPRDEPGIEINGVTISPARLVPESKLGARYLVVIDEDGRTVAKVVEHLLSAVYVTGLRGVSIQSPLWVPVVGPGINGIYNTILSNSRTIGKIIEPTMIHGEHIVETEDGLSTLSVSPANTLHVIIERIGDPEIGVDSIIEFPDLYETIKSSEEARMARPIARVRHPLVNGFQKGVERLGGKGVSKENYIFNRPRFSPEDVTKQMIAGFPSNEHLAHTATADFLGELHTYFPNGLHGKLHFSGKNTHPIRLKLLEKLLLAHLYGK